MEITREDLSLLEKFLSSNLNEFDITEDTIALLDLKVRISQILLKNKHIAEDYRYGKYVCEKCIDEVRGCVDKGTYAFSTKTHSTCYFTCDRCNQSWYIVEEIKNESLLAKLKSKKKLEYSYPEQIGLNNYVIGGEKFE